MNIKINEKTGRYEEVITGRHNNLYVGFIKYPYSDDDIEEVEIMATSAYKAKAMLREIVKTDYSEGFEKLWVIMINNKTLNKEFDINDGIHQMETLRNELTTIINASKKNHVRVNEFEALARSMTSIAGQLKTDYAVLKALKGIN